MPDSHAGGLGCVQHIAFRTRKGRMRHRRFPCIKGKVAEVLSKFDFGAGGGLVPYPIYEADEKTPLLVEPMTRDRIAIARAGGEGKVEETAGIAIWASVSDEVDAKIREQIQARVFPIRLKSEDWASGDTTWLLDVIAPSQKVATAVLANFKQVVKDKPVRIHPLVSQLVDPAVLEKMKVRPVGEAEGKTETA